MDVLASAPLQGHVAADAQGGSASCPVTSSPAESAPAPAGASGADGSARLPVIESALSALSALRGSSSGRAVAAASAALLAACGGGSDIPATPGEAARFLSQASFGPSKADIERLMAVGYSAWIVEQLALPQQSMLAYWDARNEDVQAIDETKFAGASEVLEAFWQHAVAGDTQLRDRIAFALSQIFVVSMADSVLSVNTRMIPSYYDMLAECVDKTYRELLQRVALHPAMGTYLSHIRNQKEDATGRVPDQNFAREVMQLFSIGPYLLNPDGSVKLDANGKPIEAYGPQDIQGLSRVFTGWSWAGTPKADGRFYGTPNYQDPDRFVVPMEPYPKFHSVLPKTFLGVTIPAQTTPDAEGDLKIALDTLAAHPNVAPFFCRQLIQRLVTSNPSPGYVERVGFMFRVTNGDLRLTVSAILLDTEARDAASLANPAFGKLREPVLRLTAVMRAFGVRSESGRYMMGLTDAPDQLAQTPLRSPSVFNFYRPGYVPPGTELARRALVAPELQILNESTVGGYVNFLLKGLQLGFGRDLVHATGRAGPDIQFAFTDIAPPGAFEASPERSLVSSPASLVEHVNQRLLGGAMSAALRADMQAAVEAVGVPTPAADGSNAAAVDGARRRRVALAIAMAAVSPEFLIQR